MPATVAALASAEAPMAQCDGASTAIGEWAAVECAVHKAIDAWELADGPIPPALLEALTAVTAARAAAADALFPVLQAVSHAVEGGDGAAAGTLAALCRVAVQLQSCWWCLHCGAAAPHPLLLAAVRLLFMLSKRAELDDALMTGGAVAACMAWLQTACGQPGVAPAQRATVAVPDVPAGSVTVVTSAAWLLRSGDEAPSATGSDGGSSGGGGEVGVPTVLDAATYVTALVRNVTADSDARCHTVATAMGGLVTLCDLLAGVGAVLTAAALAPSHPTAATTWAAAEKPLMQVATQVAATVRSIANSHRLLPALWSCGMVESLFALLQLPRVWRYTDLLLNLARLSSKLCGHGHFTALLVGATPVCAAVMVPPHEHAAQLAAWPADAAAAAPAGATLPPAAALARGLTGGTGALLKRPLHAVLHALTAKRSHDGVVSRLGFALAHAALVDEGARAVIAAGVGGDGGGDGDAHGGAASAGSRGGATSSLRGVTLAAHTFSRCANALLASGGVSSEPTGGGDDSGAAALTGCMEAGSKMARLLANLSLHEAAGAAIACSRSLEPIARLLPWAAHQPPPHSHALSELALSLLALVTNASFFVDPADADAAALAVAAPTGAGADGAVHPQPQPAPPPRGLAVALPPLIPLLCEAFSLHALPVAAGVLATVAAVEAADEGAEDGGGDGDALGGEGGSGTITAHLPAEGDLTRLLEAVRSLSNCCRSFGLRALALRVWDGGGPAPPLLVHLGGIMHSYCRLMASPGGVNALRRIAPAQLGLLGEVVYTGAGLAINLLGDSAWADHAWARFPLPAMPHAHVPVAAPAGTGTPTTTPTTTPSGGSSSFVDCLIAAIDVTWVEGGDDGLLCLLLQAVTNLLRLGVRGGGGGVGRRLTAEQALALLPVLGSASEEVAAIAAEDVDPTGGGGGAGGGAPVWADVVVALTALVRGMVGEGEVA
jgi:hypothetical protein